MAKPHHLTISYPSTHLVESAGAIQFIQPGSPKDRPHVILIHHSRRKAYLLAKGRRNIKESRASAAIRETIEESGISSHLCPITLHSRAPPEIEDTAFTPDRVRIFEDVIEPFMLTTRQIGDGQIKLIWWYIAIVDDHQPSEMKAEPGLTPKAFAFEEAIEALKYDCDREVLQTAITVYQENFPQARRT